MGAVPPPHWIIIPISPQRQTYYLYLRCSTGSTRSRKRNTAPQLPTIDGVTAWTSLLPFWGCCRRQPLWSTAVRYIEYMQYSSSIVECFNHFCKNYRSRRFSGVGGFINSVCSMRAPARASCCKAKLKPLVDVMVNALLCFLGVPALASSSGSWWALVICTPQDIIAFGVGGVA